MSNRVEDEAKLIHVGATVPQLAAMFGMANKTVRDRVVGRVTPSRPKGQTEKDPLRYHVRDVAPLLCDPQVDIEELLKSLTPDKFPPKLQDAFWKAQKSRLEVEEKMGHLWSTERVVGAMAEAFKPMRMSILMFMENIEQQSELTPLQRRLLTDMSDSLLQTLNEALVGVADAYVPTDDEHGTPLSASALVSVHEVEADKPFDDGFGDDE